MYTVYCTGLRGWSRLALAEDTFRFSLSFSGDWIHVQANRVCRFCLVFNNCLMVWATTNPNVYPGTASLLFFPRKENRRTFFNSARKIRLKTGSISYECVRRNTVSSDSGGKSCFVPVFNDRWRVHSKSKSLLNVSVQYSRVVKIYYKKLIMRPDHVWKLPGYL